MAHSFLILQRSDGAIVAFRDEDKLAVPLYTDPGRAAQAASKLLGAKGAAVPMPAATASEFGEKCLPAGVRLIRLNPLLEAFEGKQLEFVDIPG